MATQKKTNLFDPKIVRRAVVDSFVKLHPKHMWSNPVMFLVEIGALLTTLLLIPVAQSHSVICTWKR